MKTHKGIRVLDVFLIVWLVLLFILFIVGLF